MMSAEPGDAQACAGEGRIEQRGLAADGAEREQENERSPDGAIQQLRPCRGADVSGEREDGGGEKRGSQGSVELAAEGVEGQGGHKTDQGDVPVEGGVAKEAVFQGREEQEPVEGIRDAGLHLADQRLAAHLVRVPEHGSSVVPGAGLDLQPGGVLIGEVGLVEIVVLRCEESLPVDPYG
jgi:hypothetical protein